MSTPAQENVKQDKSTVPVWRGLNAGKSEQSDEALEVINIDADGDLLLRAGTALEGEKACEFRACSATMRRASPVWKTMLFGPWQEAKPAHGDWTVDLPEDKPYPFKVLLAIVHGNFQVVPESPSFEQLHDILVLTDKYDMIRVIRPWVGAWRTVVKDTIPDTGLDHIRRVHAAWQLGSEDLLHQASGTLARGLSITKFWIQTRFHFNEQDLTTAFNDHSAPPDLMDIVVKSRLNIIQDYLDFYHKQLHCRISDGETGCKTTTLDPHRHEPTALLRKQHAECDLWALGHILDCLVTSGFNALPKAAEGFTHSPSELGALLDKMFPDFSLRFGAPIEEISWYPLVASHHKDCARPPILDELSAAAGENKSLAMIRELYGTRLAAQRDKLGIQE